MLKSLGELQTVVNYAHFTGDAYRRHPIDGWNNALMVRDLTRLLTPAASESGEQLSLCWQQDWDALTQNRASEQRVSA